MARSLYTPSERARLVGRWERSGLSAAAFGAGVGVSAQTLYGWRRAAVGADRGRAARRAGGAEAITFVDLTSTSGQRVRAVHACHAAPVCHAAPAPLEVQLRSGDVLRIGCGADEHLLRTVIAALRPEAASPEARP